MGTCFVRKGMNKVFTQYELSYLDDLMPGSDKNKVEDEAEKVRTRTGNHLQTLRLSLYLTVFERTVKTHIKTTPKRRPLH